MVFDPCSWGTDTSAAVVPLPRKGIGWTCQTPLPEAGADLGTSDTRWLTLRPTRADERHVRWQQHQQATRYVPPRRAPLPDPAVLLQQEDRDFAFWGNRRKWRHYQVQLLEFLHRNLVDNEDEASQPPSKTVKVILVIVCDVRAMCITPVSK